MKVKAREEAVRVQVCEGAALYRQGRWWKPGEKLFVSEWDAVKLEKRETAVPA